jgi:hypothetical protein
MPSGAQPWTEAGPSLAVKRIEYVGSKMGMAKAQFMNPQKLSIGL